jgi:hypothetical protein
VESRFAEIAIFAPLIKADEDDTSRELARYILTLGIEDENQARIRDQAERNQQGSLSSEQQEELQNYVKAGHPTHRHLTGSNGSAGKATSIIISWKSGRCRSGSSAASVR